MLSAKLKEAAGNSADATLYVDDVFSTWLYTGNGSTQTITNGIDLAGKGGLVWFKDRTNTYNHVLQDTSVGLPYGMFSNTTAAKTSLPTFITSYDSNGFSIGAGAAANNTGDNIVSWTFRKAAKFFDVVTYTGTGSARTIAHSLGVAPGMVIVKRTDTTGNWQVYHRSLTSAAYSTQLNLTNAEASAPTVWNSTAPTSSVFSVGTDATVNASGGTYVAYLYAHDTSSTGIIQCGSFTTDASGNFTSVTLGWEPQYLLVKRSNSTGDWVVVDTMRGFDYISGSDKVLSPNTSDAEAFGGYGVPTATGFSPDASGGSYSSSSTYIYMAIRMPNKPPTTGTQVYNAIARTGTGAAVTLTGLGFTPDLLFDCNRNATATEPYKYWWDRLRGYRFIASSVTNAEAGGAADLAGFDTMNGVKFGSSPSLRTNGSGYTYINWFFKRAPGFFDEVCYTGTGSATTQAHNLTVVPEMIIVKERSVSSNWVVYHSALGNTKYITLNGAGSPATSNMWNNTTPTNAVFSVGVVSEVNSGSETYVAYLFATFAGISKVGSYTGNGTGQAIACGFGSGGARFVLIKRTDGGGGGWYTFDSTRGLTSGSSPYLLLNDAAAEVTGNNGVYASSGGFTLGATAITTTNIASATYIFLAVA
jgi:hypothetical protein